MGSARRLLHRTQGLARRPHSRWALLLVGAVGLIVAGVGAALILRSEDPSSDRVTVTAGRDRPVNQDRVSVAAHNSPTIAQSPTDTRRLVVADKVDRPRFTASLHVSNDGGRSWADVAFPTPRGEDRPYAPDLAWSADGTLFMAFVTLFGRGNSPGAVWTTSSRDGGRSWARPRRVLGRYAFQVRLALDPGGNALYMTWLQATEDAISCVNCFAATGLPILASRSSDGGASWTKPARVSAPDRERVGAPVPAVARTGELYVLYYDFKDDVFLWQNLQGAGYRGSYELVLSRGRPGTDAFREATVEPRVVPGASFLVYLPEFPSLAFDHDRGTLYAAWADSRSGSRDAYLRRSNDGGRSWLEATRINPSVERDQYLPRLSVAPGGRVDAAYLDRRDDPGNRLTAAYLAASYDAGRSWSSIALSRRLFDSTVGPHTFLRGRLQREADQGTRLGLVSGRTASYAAWTDARRGNPTSGKLDILFAPISFERR